MDEAQAYNRQMTSELLHTDEALATQAQQADMQAFAVLLRRYERPLYAYLCRMTGQPTEAEDLFQETFLRAYQHLNQYQPTRPFRPWLYAIATNQCRDFFRRQKRAPRQATTPLDQLASRAAGPDAQAMARERMERLEQAIAALPLKQRAVFLMARYQGLSYQEVAQSLKIPEGTVKSRMNKAVHTLMTQLNEDIQSHP